MKKNIKTTKKVMKAAEKRSASPAPPPQRQKTVVLEEKKTLNNNVKNSTAQVVSPGEIQRSASESYKRKREKKKLRKANKKGGLNKEDGGKLMCALGTRIPLAAPTTSTYILNHKALRIQGQLAVLNAWQKPDINHQDNYPAAQRCTPAGARLYLEWACLSKLRQIGCIDFGAMDPGLLPWFPDAGLLPSNFWWMLKHCLTYTEDGAIGEVRHDVNGLPAASAKEVLTTGGTGLSVTDIPELGIANSTDGQSEIKLEFESPVTPQTLAMISNNWAAYSNLFKKSGLSCLEYGLLGDTAPDGSAFCAFGSVGGTTMYSIFQNFHPDLAWLLAGDHVKTNEDAQNYVKLRNYVETSRAPGGKLIPAELWAHMCFAHLVNNRDYCGDEKRLKYYLGDKKLKTFVGVQRKFDFSTWHEKVNQCVGIMAKQDENSEEKVNDNFYLQFSVLAEMAVVKKLRDSSPNNVYDAVSTDTWVNGGGIPDEIKSVKFPAVMSDFLNCIGSNVVNGIPLFWSFINTYGSKESAYEVFGVAGLLVSDGTLSGAGDYNANIVAAVNSEINGFIWNAANYALYKDASAAKFPMQWPTKGLSSIVRYVNTVVMGQIGGSDRFVAYDGKGKLGALCTFPVLYARTVGYPEGSEPLVVANVKKGYYRECMDIKSCVPILGDVLARSWGQSMRFANQSNSETPDIPSCSKFNQGSNDLSFHESVSMDIVQETLELDGSFQKNLATAAQKQIKERVKVGVSQYNPPSKTTSATPYIDSMFAKIASDRQSADRESENISLGDRIVNIATDTGKQILRSQITKAIGAIALAVV